MVIFSNMWLCGALLAACVLHALASFLPRILSFLVGGVNIVLHIASLVMLMVFKVDVDEALLFFMISIFVYTLLFYIRYEICRRKARREEDRT